MLDLHKTTVKETTHSIVEGHKKSRDESDYTCLAECFVTLVVTVEVCDKGDSLENVEHDVVCEV